MERTMTVRYIITVDNVDAVHTFLEGAMEVHEDDGDNTSERYLAIRDAFNDSIGAGNVPHTIEIPSWLADELNEECA
jgi:hypothetical protein